MRRREQAIDPALKRIFGKMQPGGAPVGVASRKQFLLITPVAGISDLGYPQRDISAETLVGAVPQIGRKPPFAADVIQVVVVPVPLPDGHPAVRRAQVILQFVAEIAIVDQVRVDVEQKSGTEQVVQPVVSGRPVDPHAHPSPQSQRPGRMVIETRNELPVPEPIYGAAQHIGGRQRIAISVGEVQLLPIDLRNPDVALPPCRGDGPGHLRILVGTGQVAVIVGQRIARVVPVERRTRRGAPQSRNGRSKVPAGVRSATPGNQRHRRPFAADAGRADASLLVSPGRIVKTISGRFECFAGRSAAQSPLGRGHQEHGGKGIFRAEPAPERKTQRPLVGVDAPDMPVTPPAPGSGRCESPAAAQGSGRDSRTQTLPETAVGKHPACTAAGRLVQNVEIVFANVTGIADRRNGRRDPRLFIQPDGSLANGR